MAIGDLSFVDETRALAIKRDNGERAATLKCAGDPAPDYFPLPAVLKRIVLIDTASVDAEGFVHRIGYVDLMKIAEPDAKARVLTAGGSAGLFSLPILTLEDVLAVDNTHIMVGVDNNLPYSAGRAPDRAADEVVPLSVPEFLAAK